MKNPKNLLRLCFCGAMIIAIVLLTQWPTLTAQAAVAGPALAVDTAIGGRHPISDDIYGINEYDSDPALAAELRFPVRRWGGNLASRYNWQNDSSNSGSDWFFIGGSGDSNPVAGASTDAFIDTNRAEGSKTILTIPMMDYINKSADWNCGFKESIYGAQESTEPAILGGDCGNGVYADHTTIVGNDPTDTSVANTPAFQQGWLSHLIGKYGTAANGGVQIYQLDNEPSDWFETHRDIHPAPLGYIELLNRSKSYAAAIKQSDPSAKVLGPGDFGYFAYITSFDPNDGPNQHNGLKFAEFYLQQMAAYQQSHGGLRLLDYFDEHYYPESKDVTLTIGAGTAYVQALRLRSTRSLWDPTYEDEESWINQINGFPPIQLIPTFKSWINTYYPGTKTAITEYNFGGIGSLNGALAQADALGIFGREGLDLATIWDGPTKTQPVAYAFRMYRNYDGNHAHYGDTWVQSTSGDQGQLAIYGALRSTDNALTLMIINKTANDLTSSLSLAGYSPASAAKRYVYSAANLNLIVHQADLPVTSSGFTATYPANSITLLVLAPGQAIKTVGIFRPSSSTFYLRNSNTTGNADIATTFGASTDLPVTGDWNGDGIDTVGVYRPSTGQFFLRDSNTPGAPVVYSFVLGAPGDLPMAGDWTNVGHDGVGVFRPSNGLIYLKNSLTTGFADFQMVLGIPGDIPVAGDWNGDGKSSPGVYRPSLTKFFLSDQVCNCSVFAGYSAVLGVAGDSPFAGDWDGDGLSGIGVFRPSNGLIYLKNAPTTGFADLSLVFGVPNDKPVAGHWAASGPIPPKLAPTFVP
ncbi:MAG: glycoside hydrolase family 44 protein [Chloroflexota bacterium]